MSNRSRAFNDHSQFLDKPQGITGTGQFHAAPSQHGSGRTLHGCRAHRPQLPTLSSALHCVLPLTGGIWLPWPMPTSAQSPQELPHEALSGGAPCLRLVRRALIRPSIPGTTLPEYRRDAFGGVVRRFVGRVAAVRRCPRRGCR